MSQPTKGPIAFNGFHRTPLEVGQGGLPIVVRGEDEMATRPGALQESDGQGRADEPNRKSVRCRRQETEHQGRRSRCGPPVPAVVCIVQTNQQKYFVPVVFAVLLVAQSDPGGAIGSRMAGMSLFALLGALVTAFGFYVGDEAWGFVVLAVFAVTLACGLAVKLGVDRFAAGLLLNVWFLVVLSLATHDTGHLKISPWDQALAWLVGAAAWIALMFVVWVVSRGRWRPAPVMDLPGSQSPVQLTRPIVLFG